MLNSVSLVGRLVNNPSFDGEMCEFSLGVNEFYKENNELLKKTHIIPCTAWYRIGEIVAEFSRKGSQLAIRGQLIGIYKECYVKVLEVEFLGNNRGK